MMGLLGKLAFWKKDDLDFGDLGPKGGDPFGNDQFKTPRNNPLGNDDPFQQDPFSHEPQKVNEFGMGTPGLDHSINSVQMKPTQDPYGGTQAYAGGGMGKDIEIISAKIDTIRVSMENLGHKIDNLTQRVAAIEQIAKQEQQTQNW